MWRAAKDYAEGRSVPNAPPSLRVYILAKRTPALLSGTNLLDAPAQLGAEIEVYVHEEARAEREAAERADRQSPHGTPRGRRVAGRRR